MKSRLISPLYWPPEPNATFIGIDGAKGGWVVASIKDRELTLVMAASIHDITLPLRHRGLVDMPIGLPDSNRRACDGQARELLGTRRSTLFLVPTRRAIYASSYRDACDINAGLQNMKLSKQLWNITPKIKELDTFLHATPSLHDSVAEGHPELAFLSLSTDQQALPPKRTDEGREKRLAILQNYLKESLNLSVSQFRDKHPREVDMTDILDAIALATLLYRSSGEAHFLGDGALDAFGVPCRICHR